jgi:hypothetical protein
MANLSTSSVVRKKPRYKQVENTPFRKPQDGAKLTGILRARQVGGRALALGHNKPLQNQDRKLVEGSHPNPAEFQRYGKQFDKTVSYDKGVKPDARKQMVGRLLKYEYGDNNWRKRVYGENYKPGTVKNLNTSVQKSRGTIEELQKQIAGFQGKITGDTDEATKKALKTRISELEGKQNEAERSLGLSKEQRQKYLDMRDKALRNVFVNMKSRGKAGEAARRRLVRKALKNQGKPKAQRLTTS